MKVADILKIGSIWKPGKAYTEGTAPVVSIILPTYSRAKSGLFSKAVESVITQTMSQWELIIVDDASIDGTEALIEKFMRQDPRISTIRHNQNIGLPAISEYEGYRKCRAEYIAFLFDDCQWDPEYLQKTIDFMQRRGAKASYGILRVYIDEGSKKYLALGESKGEIGAANLSMTNPIGNAAVLLHRSVLETVGLYDPHICLTRVCDWDLWKRLTRRFDFYATGIMAGDEYGVLLKDSLGNSVAADEWASLERMRCNRNVELLPAYFEQLDIFELLPENTRHYADCLLYFVQRYRKKNWFLSDDENLLSCLQFAPKKTGIRRIGIYSDGVDASMTVIWERLAQYHPKFVCGFFSTDMTATKRRLDTAYLDAAVFPRNIIAALGILKVFKDKGIPCYYYMDDCLPTILNDDSMEEILLQEKRESIQLYVKTESQENLAHFDGIIVTSAPLYNYYRHLHPNVYLIEPMIDCDNIQKENGYYAGEPIRMAFHGGNFRKQVFLEVVMPALIRLAKNTPVSLLYPGAKEDLVKTDVPGLEIVPYTRNPSMDGALRTIAKHKPMLLLHPGPQMNNGKYKTENALLNATQLGAVLVASHVDPYTEPEQGHYFTAENTADGWYEVLKTAIEDEQARRQIYTKALAYCRKCYGKERFLSTFEAFYNGLLPMSDYYGGIRIRQDDYWAPSRINTGRKLCLSHRLSRSRCFRVTCTASNLAQIGIIPYADAKPSGTIRMELTGGGVQRVACADLSEVISEQWFYFSFEPIMDTCGTEYTVRFTLDYAPGSPQIRVFEYTPNRTFWYKAFNKLRIPIPGRNVLFYDCRERQSIL